MRSVLAIEPSADRAAQLRAVAQRHLGDSLTLVDSVNSAIAAVHRLVPELILISPSLPPDKKAELIAGLRALPNTTAVQTLTTPDFTIESAAFVTQLQSYVSQPHEQPDDSVPSSEDGNLDRRRAFRTTIARGPRMTVNGTPVVLVDRSATGVQVISAAMLAPGQSVDVTFDYGGKIVKSGAAVVWATLDNPLSEHVRCRAALRFDNPEPFLAIVQQDEVPAPEVPGLVRRSATQVERAKRLERNELPWLSVKLPDAGEARLLNLSASGMLLETSTKFAPGSTTAVQLCGADQTRVVRARFVRSDILAVGATGVKYVAAATFEDTIDLDGLQPETSPSTATPPNAVAEWLKSLAAEIYRGADRAAVCKQIHHGVTKLLSVGRVEILAGAVPPPDGCDSMYFTIVDGNDKAVLRVTFEHGQALSENDLQVLRAASALGTLVLSRS